MPTTRSQRARGRGRGRGRGQGPGPGRGRGDNAGSRADLLPEVPVHGDPPLGHDSQGKASIPSNRRSSSGTTFIIDRVQRYESQRGAYFAFQLNGPVSVRIYTATEKSQNVECTCTEYRSRQEFCMHIYWLFTELNSVLHPPTASVVQPSNHRDMIAETPGIEELVGLRLSPLPPLLDTTGEEVASDTENVAEVANSQLQQIHDMLSVFDRTALPEEYGEDFEPVPTLERPQSLFVANNLAATVYRLAKQDNGVFQRLREVITPDVCAYAHFTKLRERSRQAFTRLDQYVQNGPSGDADSDEQDIPTCARALRLLVAHICQAHDLRRSNGPLSPNLVTKVAEILVEILQEVCNRNENVYHRIGWEREIPDDEPDRNRNLYAYLIDDPPPSRGSTPTWMKETFIIDRLRRMPANEWRHLLERLTNILDQMREYASDEDNPPTAYAKLDRMIQDYTAEAFEPSSSSVQRRPTLGVSGEGRSSSMQRRPTLADQRESRRRRIG